MAKEYKSLKAYRKLVGINQSDLAQMLGIGTNTYSFKENGKTPFTLDEAKTIADFFGATVDEIFFMDTVNGKLIKTTA
ncbi:MAG: helix-turn-helix domain-containing protein [Anaeromicrobium sp.]|jgi:DNA-binding XRE family transcriptional regulator|uniref:helix-turn-helix transcriptional regulator n=1 Tax=Anaeromicrobium sp. TaxID=1929132 RepID=UPI0025D58DEC|nr:helix-turn-helix transcriptional regulator [Anaeromicrobium sp.]MCT4593139.1 helix-turn-helix domain-containing protein [Anaeromicrobium sp.]